MHSRSRSLLTLLTLCGGAALLGTPALAQGNAAPAGGTGIQIGTLPRPRGLSAHVPGTMGIPQPEPKITLNFTNLSLARSLNELFKQSGATYRVLCDMGTARYSLNVQRMPFSQALRQLLDQDKSTEPLVFRYQRNLQGGGEYIIDRELIDVGYSECENRVSLANARITRVLPLVFKQMKVPFRIEPDVPPVLVSMQLRPQEWEPVVQQVILEAYQQEPTLTYSMEGDTYVVHLQKLAVHGAPGMPARRVKVSAESKPLKQVLAELFEGSTLKYELSPAVRDVSVTYNVTNEPELAALQGILRAAAERGQPLSYREGNGVLLIEPGLLPGDYVVQKPKTGGAPEVNLVTVDFKGTRLKDVLERLAVQSSATIILAPNVPNLPVTMKIENVTLDVALEEVKRALKKQLPNLVWRKDGTEYLVAVR